MKCGSFQQLYDSQMQLVCFETLKSWELYRSCTINQWESNGFLLCCRRFQRQVTGGSKLIVSWRRFLLLNADLQLSEITQGLLSPRCIDRPWSVTQWNTAERVCVWFVLVLRTRGMKGNQTKTHVFIKWWEWTRNQRAFLSVTGSQNTFKGWSHFRFEH